MSKFKDHKGKESMMRKISWLLIIVGCVWGSAELIYNWVNVEYNIHETLILTTIGIGVTGKAGQSFIEKFKNSKEII